MNRYSRREFLKGAGATGAALGLAAFGPRLIFAQPGTSSFRLRILHTNDHHARIEPVTSGDEIVHGGVARRKAMIDAIRAEGGNLLVLDAGDVFQGTLFFNQYQGLADAEFYRGIGYNAMTLGNHDFNLGPAATAAFIDAAGIPVVSANISTTPDSPLAGRIQPRTVLTIGGERVGIFGLTTEETPILSSPGNTVSFSNYIEAARAQVAALQAEGVNKIIALTHIGVTFDRELAAQVPGISAIVGGHSHTPMGAMLEEPGADNPYPEITRDAGGNPVVLVSQAWEWGRWLGDMSIDFDAAGNIVQVLADPKEVAPSITPDAAFEARIEELRGPIEELINTPLGTVAVDLNAERGDVRTRETNMGNLIANAMLEATASQGVVACITNGGGIRASIPAGNVTLGQVLEVLPFGNTLFVLDLTGAQILAALENGVSRVEDVSGRFPQIAGMRFMWNPNAEPGNRVRLVSIDGRTLDPSTTYRIVTNNFVASGGDDYQSFTEASNAYDTFILMADTVADYIRARPGLSIGTEGRISRIAFGAAADSRFAA